ncbi:carboxypeptidase regulatory-like domain-containing protein [bacterium]|nr:carboxypeptidase regulatory-like domain-containing protein [bacterium]
MQRKPVRRLLTVACACFVLLAPASLLSQLSTAKVEGIVRDKETGQPLTGAQVVVEGTRLGNVTNSDGYYFVLDVSPGRRSITFSYTGYQKVTIADQLILAGQTTTVDAYLSSTVVELSGITVEGESEVLVPRDNTVTKQRMTAEKIAESPTTKLDDLLVLEAGVQIGGEGGMSRGVRIRGGRLGEEAVVVDGVTVRNYTVDPFRSGDGWVYEQEQGSMGGDASPLEFSTNAVEQVDIITGGFQAEFGNAQSGIINIVTKEGSPDLRGSVRMTTDEMNPRTADYGYNQLQTTVGGPVPFISNFFFQGSAEIQGAADRTPTHADEGFRGINQDFVDRLNNAVRNDPVLGLQTSPFSLEDFRKGREFYAGKTGVSAALWSPENPVRQPGNWGDRTLASGKLTYSPIKGLKLLASSNFSRNQHSYPWRDTGNYFRSGIITKSEFPNRDWSQGSDTTIYIPQAYGARTRTSNLLFGADWSFLQTSQRNASLAIRFNNLRNQDINGSSLRTNYKHDNTFMSWTAHDIPFEVEAYPNQQFPSDPADYHYLPDGATWWNHDGAYETPFAMVRTGREDWLYWLNYMHMFENQYNWKADLDFQVNRANRAKLGLQATFFENRKFWICNDYRTRDKNNEFHFKPEMYAFYIQNRTDLGDLVFDYGLRYDSFNPKTNWGGVYWGWERGDDPWGEDHFVKTIKEFSPRFDVAFPVTDRSQLRFAYGVFTQLPPMTYIYSGSNFGDLDYSRTDAFEAGLSRLLSSDYVLDLVAYYRDVTGNVAQKDYFVDYWQYHSEKRIREVKSGYTNRDNGNIKGVDITLRKNFSSNFAFNLMYTLQFSRTTGSDFLSSSNLSQFIDASTGESFTPPDELTPITGDVTHKMSFFFNYLFPEDFQTGSLAGAILRNTGIYAVYSLQSGAALWDRIGGFSNASEDYSWFTRRGDRPIGGINYFRGRWTQNLDLRMNKAVSLGVKRRINLFCEVFNLLNRKINTPYPKGDTYSYETNSHVTGGVDWYWNDPNLTSDDRIRFNADFNQDGMLSVMEATKGEIANLFMLDTMDKQTWGTARQVRLGFEFTY